MMREWAADMSFLPWFWGIMAVNMFAFLSFSSSLDK